MQNASAELNLTLTSPANTYILHTTNCLLLLPIKMLGGVDVLKVLSLLFWGGVYERHPNNIVPITAKNEQ